MLRRILIKKVLEECSKKKTNTIFLHESFEKSISQYIYIYRPINLPRFRFKVREFPDKVSLYRFRSTWLAAGE